MNIKGVGTSKVISIYNNNKRVEGKKEVAQKKDMLEISSTGKSLSTLSLDGDYGNSPEKVEALRKQVSQGNYKPDGSSTARKIIDIIRGRDV
jgi:negative regulator of flagellin synthesis FlgM